MRDRSGIWRIWGARHRENMYMDRYGPSGTFLGPHGAPEGLKLMVLGPGECLGPLGVYGPLRAVHCSPLLYAAVCCCPLLSTGRWPLAPHRAPGPWPACRPTGNPSWPGNISRLIHPQISCFPKKYVKKLAKTVEILRGWDPWWDPRRNLILRDMAP